METATYRDRFAGGGYSAKATLGPVGRAQTPTNREDKMDASIIVELASRVADVIATAGDPAIDVGMAEMGDGSRRHFARVTTYDETNQLEQEYRVTTPAPWNSPAWASDYRDWQVEIRVGDRWIVLEGAEA